MASKRILCLSLLAMCGSTSGIVAGQQSPAAPARSSSTLASRPQTATPQGQFKGIFEPVNFPQDIKLTDVFFVSADVGWAAGEHSTIIKTSDGGTNWTAQVGGDPGNMEQPIAFLRFLDERRGWAVQGCAGVCSEGYRLLHTRDGQNWEEAGLIPRGVVDFTFTNGRHGIALTNGSPDYGRGAIFLTDDAGKTWKALFACMVSSTVQGLARNDGCWFERMEMLSDRTGFALAHDNGDHLAIFRTDDAGRTWNYRVLPMPGKDADFFFTDVNHGLVILNDGKTYVTQDGGGNWTAMLATTLAPQIRFADPQVGWTFADGYDSKISYTTDGGQHWSSFAVVHFPANDSQYKFFLPRRDRGYIVGSHGMIYRYRVVPQNYTAANSFNAQAMPSFDVSQFAGKTDQLRQEIAQLQAKLGAAPNGGAQGAAPASAPATAGQGGFTQDTGGFSQDTTGLPAIPDATAGRGFAQDVGVPFDSAPVSQPIQDCCSAQLTALQGNLGGFSQSLPMMGSNYRSLNLITAGFTLFNALSRQAQQMRTAFNNLKHAKDLQSASFALQQLSNALNSSQQTVTTGLPAPGAWYASGGGGFVQDVDTPAGGTNQPAPAQPFAAAPASGASPAMSASPATSAMPASAPQQTAPANSAGQQANTPDQTPQNQQGPNQPAPPQTSGNAQGNKTPGNVGDAINKAKQKLKIPF
jgi:photosystem II stability/assembly factor-like uncharacterized protein